MAKRVVFTCKVELQFDHYGPLKYAEAEKSAQMTIDDINGLIGNAIYSNPQIIGMPTLQDIKITIEDLNQVKAMTKHQVIDKAIELIDSHMDKDHEGIFIYQEVVDLLVEFNEIMHVTPPKRDDPEVTFPDMLDRIQAAKQSRSSEPSQNQS